MVCLSYVSVYVYHVCMWLCMCHSTCVEDRGQLCGVGSLFPYLYLLNELSAVDPNTHAQVTATSATPGAKNKEQKSWVCIER